MPQLQFLAGQHQRKPGLGKEKQLIYNFLKVSLIAEQHLRTDIHDLLLSGVGYAQDLLAVVRVDHLSLVHRELALRN